MTHPANAHDRPECRGVIAGFSQRGSLDDCGVDRGLRFLGDDEPTRLGSLGNQCPRIGDPHSTANPRDAVTRRRVRDHRCDSVPDAA